MSQVERWLKGGGERLSASQRATHTHVIGQPGTGKSRTLESWVMQDVMANRALAVLDPHGELYDHLVLRIAALLPSQPRLAERIVLLDPTDKNWTVGFNPLKAIPGIPQERLAWFLTDVIVKIWKLDATSAPRMVRLLTYTFLALSGSGLSLLELPRFLTDSSYRQLLIARSPYREVADYFLYEFPQKPGAAHQWVTPVLNKIGPLIFDPDVRLMLAGGSTISFRDILERNLILLVKLSKGLLGEGNSALLGAFIVAHLQQAALARAKNGNRTPFFLYLDEFQNYTTDNIKDILSESRKYGLSLVMAHQYLDQLSADLRGAVLNTAGTLVCFRVGYQDATTLSRELFSPQAMVRSHQELAFMRVARFPMPYFREERETGSHEEAVTLLTQLRPREFWAKPRGPQAPSKHRALDMPQPLQSRELLEARKILVDTSGRLYGRLKASVRKENQNDKRRDHEPAPPSYYEEA